jgi:hypothetical protein
MQMLNNAHPLREYLMVNLNLIQTNFDAPDAHFNKEEGMVFIVIWQRK